MYLSFSLTIDTIDKNLDVVLAGAGLSVLLKADCK